MGIFNDPKKLSDEMAAIRKKIQEIRQQTFAAQEATIQAEKKDAEYTARIANSERTCAELTVFDPADLTLLQAKYSVLTSSHGWKPLTLAPGKQTWLYDDILEAHFSNQGDSFLVKSNIHEYKPSTKVYIMMITYPASFIFKHRSLFSCSIQITIA